MDLSRLNTFSALGLFVSVFACSAFSSSISLLVHAQPSCFVCRGIGEGRKYLKSKIIAVEVGEDLRWVQMTPRWDLRGEGGHAGPCL